MARPSKPWFRESKGTWYCTLHGRMVSLGVQGRENKKEAERAWHRLLAGVTEERTTPKDDGPAVTKEGPTVAEVIKAFLDDIEGRGKPNTVRVYRYFLRPFRKRHGRVKASDLTPVLAEGYARKKGWSDSTRNAFLGALVTAFRWAVRKARIIPHNPLEGLERPPKASRGADSLAPNGFSGHNC
jgi:hypothetical protein